MARRRALGSWLLGVVCAGAALLASCAGHDSEPVACQVEPSRTFHERIEPLLGDDRVSTCNQCHLSGVNLAAFARSTPCETWACLREQGLVNIDSPEDSKILSWIERASPDSDLITPEVIDAERDAFRDWIDANAACPSACAGVSCGAPDAASSCAITDAQPSQAPTLDPASEDAGCTDLELERAFYEDVYSWRGRCFPCHFDTESDAGASATRWISAAGNCQTGSAVSLARVVGSGLIDSTEPTQSLLLQKPLDVPPGSHGGGAKFTTEDPAYQSFLRFIQLYQRCKNP